MTSKNPIFDPEQKSEAFLPHFKQFILMKN